MGTDIHSHVEVYRDGHWHKATGAIVTTFDEWDDPSEPFGWRNYGMFGFLADVRNYHGSPVIAEPRGLPDDVSPEVRADHGTDDPWYSYGFHSATWLTLAELLAYDYDQTFIDQREDPPAETTVREFLDEAFFIHLDDLRKIGEPEHVRVVMYFDS